MPSVDELLRDGVRALADVPAGSADELERDVLDRVARRRRRRRALSVAAVLAVVAAGGALVAVQTASDQPNVAVGDPGPNRETTPSGTGAPTNRPVSIAIQREANGGVNVVFTFEAPLPASPPQPIPGVESVPRELSGVVYTTQKGGPGAVIHQCDTSHSGFSPLPLETGSVDLFFPAAWVPPDFGPFEDVVLDTGIPPDEAVRPGEWNGKFVGCGPYEGYVQYSVWAPPSDDLEDVNVSVTGVNRLVVEIRP